MTVIGTVTFALKTKPVDYRPISWYFSELTFFFSTSQGLCTLYKTFHYLMPINLIMCIVSS